MLQSYRLALSIYIPSEQLIPQLTASVHVNRSQYWLGVS